MKPSQMSVKASILHLLRVFQQKTCSIIPRAEELSESLTILFIQATRGVMASYHQEAVRRLKTLQEALPEKDKDVVNRCIMALDAKIKRPKEEARQKSGDGTDPNE